MGRYIQGPPSLEHVFEFCVASGLSPNIDQVVVLRPTVCKVWLAWGRSPFPLRSEQHNDLVIRPIYRPEPT